MTQTPPGWYDDPSGAVRWWDGERWTEHTRTPPADAPAPAAVPSSVPASRGSRRWWWAVAAVAVLAAAGVGGFLLLRTDSPRSVVTAWEEAETCAEMDPLVDGHPWDLVGGEKDAYCGFVESFFDDYDYTFRITKTTVDGDRATVEVRETGTYRKDDDEGADFDLDSTFDLRKVDGDWQISGYTTDSAE